jgi:hypothetical protein
MSNDLKKDLIEVSAAAALVVATGPLSGLAAAFTPLIGAAWQACSARRMETWLQRLLATKDAAQLEAEIHRALLDESEEVVAAVVEGARAAASAISLAAVPIIAELSRRFLVAADIPRWFYRGSLELFERVSAEDIRVLRVLLQDIESITSPKVTLIAGGAEKNRAIPIDGNTMSGMIPITAIADPERIFSLIKRVGLGFESSGWGMAAAANAVVIDREVLGWLRAALVD